MVYLVQIFDLFVISFREVPDMQLTLSSLTPFITSESFYQLFCDNYGLL